MYGQRLKSIRKKLKYSQEQMAKMTNVSYRAYSSWERGDRKPPLEFLELINKNYMVNLNWLISGIGEPFIADSTNKEPSMDLKEEILKDVRLMLLKEGVLK